MSENDHQRDRVDVRRCPLCGESNDCGAAAGAKACWCFGMSIAPEVLERVPRPARGVACVCARCASGESARRQPPGTGPAGASGWAGRPE